MSKSTGEHKAQAPKKLGFGIITVSTSRYYCSKQNQEVEDISGNIIETCLKSCGHTIVMKRLIPDDLTMIKKSVEQVLRQKNLDAAVFCGGTGIAPSDMTIETVTPLLDKTLPGFGEIFRRLSFDEIGSGAVLSRATAGTARGKAIFCLPGSPNAVRLCMQKLILPEAPHIVKHAREQTSGAPIRKPAKPIY